MNHDIAHLVIEFQNNKVLQRVVGGQDQNLKHIEKQLGIEVSSRGNILSLKGPKEFVLKAQQLLEELYVQAELGENITPSHIETQLRMKTYQKATASNELKIVTKKNVFYPRSPQQITYMKALLKQNLVFGVGPAGTGKTFLAVAAGVSMLLEGKVDRMILSRPAVEAGERLGFLPGDMKEKVDPYLRPIYDALHMTMPSDMISKLMATGVIEIAPLAFMRGRTLDHAYVILDEAQNTTIKQMKMFLTRLGEGSHMVVTGDPSQVDLPSGEKSGLWDATQKLKHLPEISMVFLKEEDIVRHPLVAKIVGAYESHETVHYGA